MTKESKPVLRDRFIADTLANVSLQYWNLLDELNAAAEENEGVVPDDLVAAFDNIEGAVEAKLEQVAAFMALLETKVGQCKDEATRARNKANFWADQHARLKDYVARCMKAKDLKRSDGPDGAWNVRVQKNNPKMIVTDIDKVPVSFTDVALTIDEETWREMCDAYKQATDVDVMPKKVERVVRAKDVIAEWKDAAGNDVVPGTTVSQNESLRVW